MIIFKDHSYQTCSRFPKTNYLEGLECEQPKWVIPDGSELARKIKSTPCWEPVTDDDGNLTDIISTKPPYDPYQEIISIKQELTQIDAQSARPLRAIAAGTATDEDRARLAELENRSEQLRIKIREAEANLPKE